MPERLRMNASYDELLLKLAYQTHPKIVQQTMVSTQESISNEYAKFSEAEYVMKQFKDQIEHLCYIKTYIFKHFVTVSSSFKAHKDYILYYRALLTELTELNNLFLYSQQDPPSLISAEAATYLLQLLSPDYINSAVDTFISRYFYNLTYEYMLFNRAQLYYSPLLKYLGTSQFAAESYFVDTLVQNALGPQMTLYELIHYTEDKLRAISFKAAEKDFSEYRSLGLSCMRYIRKQFLNAVAEQAENLFGMFVYRYFGLIYQQYDIVFMHGAEYDRAKSVKMLTAVQFVLQQISQYFSSLFEALDLEYFVPDYLASIPRDLALIADGPRGDENAARRILNGGVSVSKRMFYQLSAFVKTNSENASIKLLFSRYYPVESPRWSLQVVVDLLGRVVYRVASKACECMGLKQNEFVAEYGRNVMVVCCRGSYGEFVSKTLELVVDAIGGWLQEGRE